MRRLMIVVLFVVVSLAFTGTCQSVEIEPYLKFGTIDSAEGSHSRASGHKVMIGTGVNITFGENQRFKKIFGAEYWAMAEPVDEDQEIPHDGIVLSGKFSYHFLLSDNVLVYPFAGIGLERWRRNSSKDGPEIFYGDLYFADIFLGLGWKHKNLYLETAGLFPFWSDTDSGQNPEGEIGFILNLGLLLSKNINLGLFYSQKKFQGDGSQTEFQLEQYGISIGYRF